MLSLVGLLARSAIALPVGILGSVAVRLSTTRSACALPSVQRRLFGLGRALVATAHSVALGTPWHTAWVIHGDLDLHLMERREPRSTLGGL